MRALLWLMLLGFPALSRAEDLPIVGDVEGQPLAANVERLTKAFEFLGSPLPEKVLKDLQVASKKKDVKKIQELLDSRVLFQVSINPEARVKVARGPAEAKLQQSGFVPVLIKVVNDSTVKKELHILSPQGGTVYSQKDIKKEFKDRFLHLEMFTSAPMTKQLSGLKLEYALALIYSADKGKREATIGFDIGQGTQDLGFRAEVPVLFDIKPGIAVKMEVKDVDGKPTVGRFTFKDDAGHVYPPKAKRLAPDFFFQDQIYRADGGTVLLPPGEFTVEYGRGPEYLMIAQKFMISEKEESKVEVKLQRWIDPTEYGFYSGDHHIHSAGCAHYTSPTEGVFPEDMFLHVKGEGMNVGCCLTWGPCYDFQRNFFDPGPHKLSEPFTLLKYDIEISGFGSQALGHVCLLNLRDQTYPGSEGTKTKGWPTWTTPAMRWAKLQGGVTGYAHSASGLGVTTTEATKRILEKADTNGDGKISISESDKALLPEEFAKIDTDQDGFLSRAELEKSHDRVREQLPNYAVPEMNGIGAQEICVSTAMKVCDFISAMDTQRVPEWNCWYHIMNCGFPLKASGETDFPCISGSRVGQGRVYVQLGKIKEIKYDDWCNGIAKGKSYISDGYSHALDFRVGDKTSGEDLKLEKGGMVTIKAKVAFSEFLPLGTSLGGETPKGKTRKVELIVNGEVAGSKDVPADMKPQDIEWSISIAKSSWVAIRHFPSLHTNPVNVLIGEKPIRVSKKSAQWCIATIEQLWKVRKMDIIEAERGDAEKTFQKAIVIYQKIATESE